MTCSAMTWHAMTWHVIAWHCIPCYCIACCIACRCISCHCIWLSQATNLIQDSVCSNRQSHITSCQICNIYLLDMVAKLKGDTEISTNPQISPILIDQKRKTYYTVIIRICGISLHQKINLYNTKSVFIN